MQIIPYAAAAALLLVVSNASAQPDPTQIGSFSEPFAEPTIVVDGKEVATDKKCLTNADGDRICKPAAGTLSVLGDGRFVYFNALEGTENVELSIVAEYGRVSINDQTRLLTLDGDGNPAWEKPSPLRAGANPDGNDSTALTGGLLDDAGHTARNDGALFCSDVVFLANGDLLAVGGTDYYSEPGNDGFPIGVAELEGLKNARIYDPDSNSWRQSGDMHHGRWYPTLVTQANGDVFVASGVTKLVKPVYPEAPLNSGRNVVQTEHYDPRSGEWTENPASAQRSLPLFPRLHLLPNGHIFYNAVGQSFNPFGQGYDQPLWNIASAYDPKSQTWTDLGYAGLPLQLNAVGLDALTTTLNPTNMDPDQLQRLLGDLAGRTLDNPAGAIEQLLKVPVDERLLERAIGSGMRGSTFQIMLPLRPDDNGEYHRAEFLTAGGVPTYVALGSPGGYLPISASRIDTVTVHGDDMRYASHLTGPLNRPRWFSYGVLLPDDSVMAFSGGTRDGVVLPGLENAIRQAERFDPTTQTWQPMATAHRMRTYHNTAALMPDGRVLVGGHAPINTAYLSSIDLQSEGFSPNDGRDPSFEIYSPPYAMRDDRPVIEHAPDELAADGRDFDIQVASQAPVDQVLLIRRTATTHLVDGDQRTVVLPIVARAGAKLTVRMPDNRAVAPAGPYMLFVSIVDGDMRVPSESAPIMVVDESGNTDPTTQDGQHAPAGANGDPAAALTGLLTGPGGDSGDTGGEVSPAQPLQDLADGFTELATQTPGALPLLGQGVIEGIPPIAQAILDSLSDPAALAGSFSGGALALPIPGLNVLGELAGLLDGSGLPGLGHPLEALAGLAP